MWHAVVLFVVARLRRRAVDAGRAAVDPRHRRARAAAQRGPPTASRALAGLLAGPAVGGAMLLRSGRRSASCSTCADLSAAGALAVAGAVRPALPARGAAPAAPTAASPASSRPRATIAGNRIIVSMTLLAGALVVHRRQRLPGADAGVRRRPRPRRRRRLLQHAARRRRRRRAGRRARAREPRPAAGANPRTAFVLAMLWCLCIGGFAASSVYLLALALLFAAGFLELSFNAMAQTLVQTARAAARSAAA